MCRTHETFSVGAELETRDELLLRRFLDPAVGIKDSRSKMKQPATYELTR